MAYVLSVVFIFVMQARSQSLEMLNIGHNNLTNECLHVIKDSLQQNRTLLQLGMQSTHLTCEGAIALAECIADNPVIQVCEDIFGALRFMIYVKWAALSPLLLDATF
jgi:Ran GTPase-activating protein (RanGAP) involved in mRNA processing and transport